VGIGKLALQAPAERACPRRTFYVAAIMLLMGKGVKQVVDYARGYSGPGHIHRMGSPSPGLDCKPGHRTVATGG